MFELPISNTDGTTAYVAAWLVTLAIHSTLIIGLAWLSTRRLHSLAIRDMIWRAALVLPMVTATAQISLRIEPVSGSLTLGTQGEAVAAEVKKSSSVDAFSQLASDKHIAEQLDAATVPASISSGVAQAGMGPVAQSAPPILRNRMFRGLPDAFEGISWIDGLIAIWVLGALLGLTRLVFAKWSLSQALRPRRPIHDPLLLAELDGLRREARVQRPIRLSWSPELQAPVALDQEVCLPREALSRLGALHLSAVLAHETAHVARRDARWLILSLALERIFFFQPLYVLARREMQSVAEYLCDDWAVAQTGRTLTIAESLAEVATWLSVPPRPLHLPSMAHDESQLVRRVQRLLDGNTEFTGDGVQPKRFTRLALLLAATTLISLTAPRVIPGASAETAPVNETHSAEAPMTPLPETELPMVILAAVDTPPSPPRGARAAAIPPRAMRDEIDLRAVTAALAPQVELGTLAPVVGQVPRADVIEFDAIPGGMVAEAPVAALWTGSLANDRDAGFLQDTVSQRVVQSLIRALQDSTAAVRKEAAQALGQLKAPAAGPALIATLDDEEVDVRKTVVWALARLEDQSAADGLIRALTDPAPTVRKAAADAVGKLGIRSAAPGLVNLLNDEEPEIRRVAIGQLWRLRDTSAVDAIAALTSDSVSAVRRSAVAALGRFRQPSSFAAIENALRDGDPAVRREAVRALARLGDPRAIPAYTRLLDDPSPEVRKVAVAALGAAEDTTAITVLIGATRDDDPEVRLAATNALRKLDHPRSLTPYTQLLSDPSAEVRQAAIRGLGELGDDAVIPALIEVARDDSPAPLRRAAISSLARFYRPSVVVPLTNGLSDPNKDVRHTAARALGQLAEFHGGRRAQSHASHGEMAAGLPGSVPALIAALQDDDSEVREASARTLGYLRDGRALDALVAALQDGASDVRTQAIYALGRIRDERAVDPLIAAMEDPDSKVRRAAIRTLGQFPAQRER